MRRCKESRLVRLGITIVAVVSCLHAARPTYATDAPTQRMAQATRPRAARQDVAPADMYVHTLLVRDELELLRLEMGKPQETRRQIGVSNAAPRQIFFQALTLFRRVNRLSFERTRERAIAPEKPVGTIRFTHVWALVDVTLERLQRVKDTIDIPEQSRKRPRDPSKTPSDVFDSIVQANRQVNLLMDQPIAPSDVFQHVTVAVGYAAQLLTRFPATSMAETPAFARRKAPADVYRRLVRCYARVRTVLERSGFTALTLDRQPEAVTPSDVYDLAALLVSELSFLHAHLDGAVPPPDAYYPGRKFPADVYQRAGLLEALLIDLQTMVDSNPLWLHAKDGR